MESEPRWVSIAEAVLINSIVVESTRETHFLRDPGLLDSALARPKFRWMYERRDLPRLAVDLMFAIARNHPFEQGNKRTGFVAMETLLIYNGYHLAIRDTTQVAQAIIDVLNGLYPEEAFVSALRSYIREVK